MKILLFMKKFILGIGLSLFFFQPTLLRAKLDGELVRDCTERFVGPPGLGGCAIMATCILYDCYEDDGSEQSVCDEIYSYDICVWG